jgi:hypothetical protein
VYKLAPNPISATPGLPIFYASPIAEVACGAAWHYYLQLLEPMGKLALLKVRAEPNFRVVSTELSFVFNVLPLLKALKTILVLRADIIIC